MLALSFYKYLSQTSDNSLAIGQGHTLHSTGLPYLQGSHTHCWIVCLLENVSLRFAKICVLLIHWFEFIALES